MSVGNNVFQAAITAVYRKCVFFSQSAPSPLPQVEVSPLENAIEVIENKNLQLRTLITQCQSRQMQNINPLTMCLNGVIDAAVNGGLARYQEVWTDRWRTRLEAFRDGGRGEER